MKAFLLILAALLAGCTGAITLAGCTSQSAPDAIDDAIAARIMSRR